MNNLLELLGANERFVSLSLSYPELSLCRVVSQQRNLWRVAGEQGEALAEISGKLRFETPSAEDYPAVGDFVMVSPFAAPQARTVIHRVLPRKSAFVRVAAGDTHTAQVVAANIDIAFLCMSLNQNYNLSRMERYLAVAWNSGATPVVVLTKADLCADLAAARAEVSAIAPGADVLFTSSNDPAAVSALRSYLRPGITACFLGSSGVGKSTLINSLTGQNILPTAAVGAEDRGRHTTTHRELMMLPQGGMVIDTPGMRELGVETVDLGRAFSEIDGLAEQCRFRDCTHTNEPGCAVLRALAEGIIEPRRLENYRKLQREASYDGLNARQRDSAKINAMFGGKKAMKQLMDAARNKNSGR